MSVANIAWEVTDDVRKSLILRGPKLEFGRLEGAQMALRRPAVNPNHRQAVVLDRCIP